LSFRTVVDLNLNGTWYMCQAFARRVVARGGSGGRIINIVLSIDRRSIRLRARRHGARRGYQTCPRCSPWMLTTISTDHPRGSQFLKQRLDRPLVSA
jgi:hypothetical protein